ncbi:MAG TPA: acVLRF1 family peptidyl-tRNA hydrolase [Sporichthya sp.]|nr:acVLRF1 family peptidyl-tRNA hydrolase [Sporichthya sp.]
MARRTVEVQAERIPRWFANFADRNGGLTDAQGTPDGLRATGGNGTTADCVVPFARSWAPTGDPVAALAGHAAADRRVAVLLVRLGGFAAGVFDGLTLTDSKVGSRHVQGRSAAGGWSQQRFARRRANQADAALDAATETAARILLPRVVLLDALILGGERKAVDRVLNDRTLGPLSKVPVEPRFLSVPDPRLDVLRATPAQFRAVTIHLTDPPDQR